MKKYNIADLKNIDRGEPLPQDANQHAYEDLDKINKTFNAGIDVAAMRLFEKPRSESEKDYGTFYAIGNDGRLYATFEFIKGICFKWRLVRYFGNSQVHVERYNRNIYKNKKITQGEEKNA